MLEFAQNRERLIRKLRRRGITNARVLKALDQVPREQFVSELMAADAYEDTALPAASGQTISQPFVVALMTQMLQLTGNETILEIGTGTGYQTAILGQLAHRIVTIERLPELSDAARARLASLECDNIEFHIGDGTLGWAAAAPYDGILVTAGAPEIPAPLYNQLAVGGRLVIPVGGEESQLLTLVMKTDEGPQVTDAGSCRFVKLIGDAGWDGSF